ncbi:hypothetical protein BDW69DRAFT_187269 [Aspergillus filifer]
MTLVKQRLSRWNSFVASCLWHNLKYLVGSWKLGWMEIGTKAFVFQEVYSTSTYLISPFILLISLLVKPAFCVGMLTANAGLYLLQAILINEIHLRQKEQHPIQTRPPRHQRRGLLLAHVWYAQYFAQPRLKLTEDHKVVGMVLKLEEQMQMKGVGTRRGEQGIDNG